MIWTRVLEVPTGLFSYHPHEIYIFNEHLLANDPENPSTIVCSPSGAAKLADGQNYASAKKHPVYTCLSLGAFQTMRALNGQHLQTLAAITAESPRSTS